MRKICAAIAAFGIGSGALAQVIDFQSLEHVDGAVTNHGGTYSEDGFTINDLDGTANLSSFGTLESRYPGSTALFNNSVNGEVELIRSGGGLFSLTSIDISRLNTTSPVSVTFTGFLNGVVVATQVVTTTIADNTLETFNFNTSFLGVDRVTWAQVSPFHQFDNINVQVLGAQIMDFQGLAHNNGSTANHGFSYTEDGFRIDTDPNNPFQLATFGTQQGASYPGSTALFNNTVNGVMELRDTAGRPFRLLSMLVANLNNNGPTTVSFQGFRRGVLVATRNYTTSGSANVLERVNFGNFECVDLVTWTQTSPFHQFDQIIVEPVGGNVIDFEQLRHEDGVIAEHGYAYSEHGYTLQFDTSGPLSPSGPFSTFGVQEPRYPGSTALLNDTVNGITILRRSDNTRFDLVSIDVANLNAVGPDTIRFEGIRNNVVVANQTYVTLNANNELETVVMNGNFRNLDRVRWVQDSPFNQFDNINVNTTRMIDFQALAHNDAVSVNHGGTYAEDGMVINDLNGANLTTFGTKENRYPGSTALFDNTVDGAVELVHAGGQRFSVSHIDISRLNSTSPVSVTFRGELNGNVVATQTFTTTISDNVLETFCFNANFQNIDRLTWQQASPFHQFDNIVFGNATGCAADLDGDGDADADDFFLFLDAFASGNFAVCDLDNDGDCDADDFFAYLDLFSQGC